MKRNFLFLLLTSAFWTCSSNEPKVEIEAVPVEVKGTIREIMHEGKIEPKVAVSDFVSQGSYGLGPYGRLKGELLLWDGVPYVSVMHNDKMMVIADRNASAPLFVSAQVQNWDTLTLSENIQGIKQLENFLDRISKDVDQPFPFLLLGTAEYADIHTQNLPDNYVVHSPADAHSGQENFELLNQGFQLLGFFSRNHQAVFTHMNSYTHMHMITSDRKMMGHLDSLSIGSNSVQLLLPSEP